MSNSENGAVDGNGYKEITLDVVEEELVSPEPKLLAQGLEMRSSGIRQVSQKLKHLPSLMQSRGLAQTKFAARGHALKGLKFISKADPAWAMVERRFKELTATTNGLLPRSLFGKCVGMSERSEEFTGKLFDVLARRTNISGGIINRAQLKEFWDQIADQSFESQLQTLFYIVDTDDDGRITEKQVEEMIILGAPANDLYDHKYRTDEYAGVIMKVLDTNEHGYITIMDLGMLLLHGPNQLVQGKDNLHWDLISMMPKIKEQKQMQEKFVKLWYILTNNWQRVWVMVLWVGVMAGLFTFKYFQYKNREVYDVMGHCVCFAKGAAETLKLNMALILLAVCRNSITWLRNKTKFGVVIPFDDNLNFHKVIAMAIALCTGIHVISHLTCNIPRLLNASREKYKPMQRFFGDQPTSYWDFMKGWEGVTGIIMVVLMGIAFTICASSWFRRKTVMLPTPLDKIAVFDVLWYSHYLFIIVYICLIIHGMKLYVIHEWYKKTTWMYIAVPLALYAGEKLLRAFRPNIHPVLILKVKLCPGGLDLLTLRLSKPQGFNYRSGQYILVNCPAISSFEWHPCFITSAPEDDYLRVHSRTLGDSNTQLGVVWSEHLCRGSNFTRLLIDGPYGAPTQHYKGYDVVLLVGVEMREMPMMSMVKEIIKNMSLTNEEEPDAVEEGMIPKQKGKSRAGRHRFKTRKAYFFWVTSEQSFFNMFEVVMDEVTEMGCMGLVEMHNYCTSVDIDEGDVYSVLISTLQYLLSQERSGIGIRVMSHFGKPNWRAIYSMICIQNPNTRVGVFNYGAATFQNELRRFASYFSHNTGTLFDFHKENL